MICNIESNTRVEHQERSQVEHCSRDPRGDCVKAPGATTLTFPVMEIQGLQPHAAGLNGCAAPLFAVCLFPEGFKRLCSSVHTFVKQFTSRLLGFFSTTWMNCSPKSPSDLTNNASFVVCAGCKPISLRLNLFIAHSLSLPPVCHDD